MDPDAYPALQAAASAQHCTDVPHAECDADPCGAPPPAAPLDVCMRELDALLASLEEP